MRIGEKKHDGEEVALFNSDGKRRRRGCHDAVRFM